MFLQQLRPYLYTQRDNIMSCIFNKHVTSSDPCYTRACSKLRYLKHQRSNGDIPTTQPTNSQRDNILTQCFEFELWAEQLAALHCYYTVWDKITRVCDSFM